MFVKISRSRSIAAKTASNRETRRTLAFRLAASFPNGLANSSGELGKHLMAHPMSNVYVLFNDQHVNNYMGPSAQKHTIDDFNADNFDHNGVGFLRGSQISIGTGNLEGGPISLTTTAPPPNVRPWGAAYRDFLAQYYTRHAAMVAQTENLAYPDQMIDLDPSVRDAWGLPAPRLTYDWRRPNELARVQYMQKKMEEIGHAMGASLVWRAPVSPAGAPGAHHEGGTRMGSDPKSSVVNRYGQSWDIPNLFVIGSSTFPSMSGFNPTLTIQALAFMSADAIVNRYRKSPGALL
jgi:gluconate 2-dehydrogenase alpha chain